MQKATYYDNPGLFGGYTYPKPDSYSYGPAHQSYPAPNIDTDYQGSVCPIQTSAVRPPPALKDSDLNGDCMRQSSGQSNNSSSSSGSSSQANGISEQQVPPLSASSPSSNSSASQKKKSPNGSGSGATTPALTKQIFPWMKETRQNSKQKSNSNCAAAGRDPDGAYVCMSVWTPCRADPRYYQTLPLLVPGEI
ncbi:Homeobox protein Hox-D3a [Goodea atripinnis]|uniref:Homeobox protein Hox-D3a n=1 Tax=Goodea atripinnis TaxID=208336 RepID=A0ABV0MND6_9TELE